MPAHQGLESRLVTPLHEALEQFAVGGCLACACERGLAQLVDDPANAACRHCSHFLA
jgi:hypothetical protein